MSRLDELKRKILEDGIIDAVEVTLLRKEIYADGIVDREEADFLFDLNDATSGKENHASWQDLFVEAISSHLLEDTKSPNEIDEDEATWLISRIEGDGVYDSNEKALLQSIQHRASSVARLLTTKF